MTGTRSEGPAPLPVDGARARIAARADLHAFISLTDEHGPGEVVAVKDLIDVRGTVTSCGAAWGAGPGGVGGGGAEAGAGRGGAEAGPPAAARDAEAIANLRRAGPVAIVGKANLHEWAFGVSSANPTYGAVPNPRDVTRSAGGSSSGSAAAVAAGLCDWAVGTDTAGSIRIPASLCGVVGFKPTWGTVPIAGVQPLAPSHDTVGALAPSVAVAARGVFALAAQEPPLLNGAAGAAGGEPRLARPAGWVDPAGLDDDTAAAWAPWAQRLPEIAFPDRARLFSLAEVVQGYEAAQVHAAALARDPGRFSAPVLERLRRGAQITAAEAAAASEELTALAAEADRALTGWDALALPTTACVAPPLGDEQTREPLTRFTRPFNATGQPAISLPLTVPPGTLPVGLQLVARRGDDAALTAVAVRVERLLAETISSRRRCT